MGNALRGIPLSYSLVDPRMMIMARLARPSLLMVERYPIDMANTDANTAGPGSK